MENSKIPNPCDDNTTLLVQRMGHDFNNLFSIILGGLSLLRADIPQSSWNPQSLETYEDILSATREAAGVINQLTAWAAQQSIEPQSTDINNVIVHCGELLRRALPEFTALEVITEPSPTIAWVDRSMLLDALLALAANSREAMPHGGKLILSVSNTPQPSLCISDNGNGMNQSVVAQCKQPYFTTHNTQTRRGLGLSVIDGFARASGGELLITSEAGIGTSATLLLRKTADSPPAAMNYDKSINEL